jgi:phage tail-like protein
MARTTAEDQIQSFRFRVFEVEGGPGIFADENPVAGFTTITTPEATAEMATHRTGSEKTTRKFLGPVEYGDVTMSRGILLGDSTFYNWLERYRNKQPFRTDLEVRVYNQEGDGTSPDDQHVKSQTWKECIPTTVKGLGDLDSASADVNVQEVTVAIEEYELESPTA